MRLVMTMQGCLPVGIRPHTMSCDGFMQSSELRRGVLGTPRGRYFLLSYTLLSIGRPSLEHGVKTTQIILATTKKIGKKKKPSIFLENQKLTFG